LGPPRSIRNVPADLSRRRHWNRDTSRHEQHTFRHPREEAPSRSPMGVTLNGSPRSAGRLDRLAKCDHGAGQPNVPSTWRKPVWSDNETDRDFLNFRCVADTAAEMIVQAAGHPLSMGVSGGWGAGKSSMLKLISDSVTARGGDRYLFVEFNAWLYQGYDDARAALMEVIAARLVKHGEESKTGLEKAKDLLSRVNWLRLASLTVGSALSVAAGLPPVGLIGAAWSAAKGLADGKIEKQDVEAAEKAGKELAGEAAKLIAPSKGSSPPRQIHDLRTHFAETLREMNVTLVVFIDDLDRCLPSTAISTLEAIRLFLFLKHTAFVIAADDRMIRRAVRVHFQGAELDDDLVTNYFDKLVQVPLRVPPLGTQEVRAYLMLLFLEKGEISGKERIREQICERLSESWKGHRVDLGFVVGLIDDCPGALRANLELADRLAPLMTTARQIAGNPRLIKRFLNTLAIRLAIAQAQHVAVDEAALAKMLLFERCASEEAYSALITAINDGDEGKPAFLAEWEKQAQAGEEIEGLPTAWRTDFVKDWLALPPTFADTDLRAVVYVSREYMPIITAADQLSSEAAGLLEALMGLQAESPVLADQLRALPGREIALIADRLMVRARQAQEWGTPPALWGLLAVIKVDQVQAQKFAQFLESLPPTRLQPDVIPVLADYDWARPALDKWHGSPETPKPVKRAIKSLTHEGS